jgi:hypothetical protein
MRLTSMKMIGALGIVAIWALSANAAPPVPSPDSRTSSKIVQVQVGCGWGYHITYWGGCVPNYYGYRHYGWRGHYYRGHYRRRYY